MPERTPDAYDLVFSEVGAEGFDSEGLAALAAFERASRQYLASPLPWIGWAGVLPGAALLTPAAYRHGGPGWAVGLWTLAILLGGMVEGSVLLRARRARKPASVLGGWAMSVQGNLSLVALSLSLALWFAGVPWLLPALWLLALGHSFFALGSLALRELRQAGMLYQLAGLLALFPQLPALWLFAGATFLGNLWVALGIWRRDRA
jgi:hypothetical protein